MQVQALLEAARQRLGANLALDAYDARLEAQLLLQSVLQVNRAWLLAHAGEALNREQQARFQHLLQRRCTGEPVAYILGRREFYGLALTVTPDTLIPRPDSETLVEAALARIPGQQACCVLDLGTGSGAIAIAIAAHRPQAVVTAVDSSAAALDVARHNAERLGLDNLHSLLSNWFAQLPAQTFDVIVSNPPYIAEQDPHLTQGDLRFEPRRALASGPDGLDDIRRIVTAAPAYLKPQGWLMLEHGHDQAQPVAQLLERTGFCEISSRADLGGQLRVTGGRWPH